METKVELKPDLPVPNQSNTLQNDFTLEVTRYPERIAAGRYCPQRSRACGSLRHRLAYNESVAAAG